MSIFRSDLTDAGRSHLHSDRALDPIRSLPFRPETGQRFGGQMPDAVNDKWR